MRGYIAAEQSPYVSAVLACHDSGESLSALSDKAISVVVLPKSGQTNYLASNVVNVKFNRFQEENSLSFAFNEQATRFEWNFANTKRYQFFIVLHYSSGGEEKAFVDNYQVIGQEEQIWQYYYQPSQMGTISRVELYARAVEVDPSLQMQVGLFGKIEVELSQPVEYKLFESGLSFFVVFEYGGVFENLFASVVYVIFYDFVCKDFFAI